MTEVCTPQLFPGGSGRVPALKSKAALRLFNHAKVHAHKLRVNFCHQVPYVPRKLNKLICDLNREGPFPDAKQTGASPSGPSGR